MKKYISFFAAVMVIAVQSAYSTVQLSTNPLGELVITDSGGKVIKTMAQGSVGEIVRAEEQSFKISYGKDLHGNATTILYANPEQPQTLTVGYNGKTIEISKDAVLTMVLDGNGAILQSGILGQVTVDHEKMAPSSQLRIGNSGTVMASSASASVTPASSAVLEPLPAPTAPYANSAPPTSASAPVSSRATVQTVPTPPSVLAGDNTSSNSNTYNSSIVTQTPGRSANPNATKPEVGIVLGRVYISNDGAAEQPLTDSSEIKVGSIIRTEPGSTATIYFFPDTETLLHEKSTLTVREYKFDPDPNSPNRHVVLHLSKGKVHNDLDVKGKGTTHYQVDTPHQNFVAIGTNFLVTVDEGEDTAFVQVYEGTVGDNEGRKIHARVEGLYTNTGRPPEYTPMSDELRREYENRHYGRRDREGGNAIGNTVAQGGNTQQIGGQGSTGATGGTGGSSTTGGSNTTGGSSNTTGGSSTTTGGSQYVGGSATSTTGNNTTGSGNNVTFDWHKEHQKKLNDYAMKVQQAQKTPTTPAAITPVTNQQ